MKAEKIFKFEFEDNTLRFCILGIRIKFQIPFNRLACCCSIRNLKQLKNNNTIFPHPIGIVIHKDVKIGKNCTIFQNVTIGAGKIGKKEMPVIGDNVIIYAGAVIVGDIRIGNGAIIAANSVVLSDIPDNMLAAGIPAKAIKIINNEDNASTNGSTLQH